MKAVLRLLAVVLVAAGCGAQTAQSPASTGEAIVEELLRAIDKVERIGPPSSKYGELTLDEAYAVQEVYAHKRGGAVGYKVAFASKPSQAAWGVDGPVYGPLFEAQRIADDGVVETSAFNEFRIEAEVAFVLSRDIAAPVLSTEELKTYVKSIHLAFDMPDNRFTEKPKASDIVATGAGAHRFTLGPAHDPGTVDVGDLVLKVRKDGQVVYEGSSSALEGGPWGCLLFVVNHLTERGVKIKSGTLFLSGAVDKAFGAVGAEAPGVYQGEGGTLGTIQVNAR